MKGAYEIGEASGMSYQAISCWPLAFSSKKMSIYFRPRSFSKNFNQTKTMAYNKKIHFLITTCLSVFISRQASAQTDMDAIMMSKNNFCTGAVYGYSSWTNYWEGTLKRDNANLGRVSTQAVSVMGNYGISNKLNVLFGLPYIQTKASQGVLHGQHGLQDISLWLKWMPVEKNISKATISVYGLAGMSAPVSDYTPDFLPMSIGLHSTSFSARLMADYWRGNFFTTASGTFTYRTNITLDRDSYYTTELHLTDEVRMPNTAGFNVRAGYRSTNFIAEAILSNMTTLGGFDIRRNDMPFPSNKMNATTAGAGFKYTFKKVHELSLVGNVNYTIAGRNVGQSISVGAGVFYAFNTAGGSKTVKSSK